MGFDLRTSDKNYDGDRFLWPNSWDNFNVFFIYYHIILLAVPADFVSLIGCLLLFFKLAIAPIYTSSLCYFTDFEKFLQSKDYTIGINVNIRA